MQLENVYIYNRDKNDCNRYHITVGVFIKALDISYHTAFNVSLNMIGWLLGDNTKKKKSIHDEKGPHSPF